ncbi:MAG: serine hydrolase [Candidatus Roizmanbacteria bacterium]
MKVRHIAIFTIVSFICLWYPGDHYLLARARTYEAPIITAAPSLPIPFVKTEISPTIVSAEAVYVVDVPSWTPVLSKNIHTSMYPASTAKMVTALTVRKHFAPDDIITIKTATDEGQIMNLQIGERMTVENLLYGMLVPSANDAAFAFVGAGGGFARWMSLVNETAQSLGMTESHFTNPAGLDEPGMHTTPRDLAFAARAVIQDHYLKRIVSTKSITILDEDYLYTHELTNVNQLLGVVDGLGGVKTGFTEGAGQNLVSYYHQPGTNHEYIIVVMKSKDRFKDTQEIVSWLGTSIEYVDTK